MKRLVALMIALSALAAMLLLAGIIERKQRSVSFEGAVMVTAE